MVGHTTMLELTFVKQALQVLLTPSRQGGRRRIARSATTATAAMRKLVALSVTATAAVKGFDRRLMTDTDNTEMIRRFRRDDLGRNLTFFKTKQ